jgi:hypothetical protein
VVFEFYDQRLTRNSGDPPATQLFSERRRYSRELGGRGLFVNRPFALRVRSVIAQGGESTELGPLLEFALDNVEPFGTDYVFGQFGAFFTQCFSDRYQSTEFSSSRVQPVSFSRSRMVRPGESCELMRRL